MGASIDIVKEIVATKDYIAFGMCLLNDDTAMSVIEENNKQLDSVAIVADVFKSWIQGKSSLTAERTWRTLVQCLRAKKLNTIADNIVKVFQSSPSDARHYQNKASESKLIGLQSLLSSQFEQWRIQLWAQAPP